MSDVVEAEPRLTGDVVRSLEARGDKVQNGGALGSANSILVTPTGPAGAADHARAAAWRDIDRRHTAREARGSARRDGSATFHKLLSLRA